MQKEKRIEKDYWEQEPPSLRSEFARVIYQTASRKATAPGEVPAKLLKAGQIECTEYLWRSGKLVSGQIKGTKRVNLSCRLLYKLDIS